MSIANQATISANTKITNQHADLRPTRMIAVSASNTTPNHVMKRALRFASTNPKPGTASDRHNGITRIRVEDRLLILHFACITIW
ncbi:MAG: hypothetical protein NTV22_11890 [bacterium]|nr:hypothetical protein [bacterium]